MTCYLGFDGGGTKTDCAIIDQDARVLGEGTAGPSNPLRAGYVATFAALGEASKRALAAAAIDPQQIRGVCAALAGAGRQGVADEVEKYLVSAFPRALTCVTSDFEAALEAAAGVGPGVVLIAGTGSAAFGRSSSGEQARAGGYGPWIGDEGSAYDIGRRAVAEAARVRDAASPSNPLEARILAAVACASWDDLIESVATKADEIFPRVFPAVVEAAEAGEPAARAILQEAADDLAALARVVTERLKLSDREFVLAKSGGVFGRSRILDNRLDALLSAVAPRARIEQLRTSPAVGAACIARRRAGGATQT